ncbi:S9 family peptidase [Cupriavidus sp. UYPR2.512]|uniref:alpha/beta hydrolase family protein n=1 Tax=Cupriavidus sp. UYPR2.512 TaxID=1080187 RepID=UPI0003618FE3|nr:alpha/beta fold hydrolase [Cupriavidus sp. UYPR2.512]UIF84736.1 alpha/beta fold hydrolase [Cupriavidus necator]
MDTTRKGQKWILDALIAVAGLDVLHPGAARVMEQLGYDATDLKRVFEPLKSGSMAISSWSSVARDIEGRANHWAARGFQATAKRMFERAGLLYARTHYSIHDIELRKRYWRKYVACFDKVAELANHHIERVRLPFEDFHVHGLFETQRGARSQPCVILLPGMDMFKEDWHKFMEQRVLPRGWCAFAIDGPGQGESLTHGLKLSIENFDRAINAVVDWLSKQEAVDPNKIVIMGSSMGSWWATRAAAAEPRLKAVAANMSSLGSDKWSAISVAQPSYMTNLMFMTGINDVEKLETFIGQMTLEHIAPKVKVPYLIVTGEIDELTTLDATFATYDALQGPKEAWVYEHDFHPIGPTSDEWLTASLDWLDAALSGALPPALESKVFITKDGEYIEGNGRPRWLNP